VARGPAYRVETPRLVLRCWQPSDAEALHAAVLESVAALRPWIPWAADEPRTVAQRVETLRRHRGELDLGQNFLYGVFDPAERTVFGGIGLHARVGPRALEVGYWIRSGSVGQGLAKEAASAMTRIAFEIEEVERLDIHCDPGNGPSASVAARLGFRHEATLRKRFLFPDGTWRDSMIWSLLPGEYRASKIATLPVRAYDASGRVLLG
jgi:RimJ/RimL family protein N-acetyltransferase